MDKKIKVLIVDDSRVVRDQLEKVLLTDPKIIIIGKATDPFEAASFIKTQVPDVITLDVEMPKMDGITFLKKIMSQHPIPVVMVSSLTKKGTQAAIKSLEYGAIDIIEKPHSDGIEILEEANIRLIDTVKAAAKSSVKKLNENIGLKKQDSSRFLKRALKQKVTSINSEKIVLLGASTGGTEAIRYVLSSLPPDCPGIVIVQHMPVNFTNAFAKRLNDICKIRVKELEDNDAVEPGLAIIAEGGQHMVIKRIGRKYKAIKKPGPLVSRHCPSVDVLFRSGAQMAGANAFGIILTGMGNDGAAGMLAMKETGAYNVAQDEQSCVVYGMPKKAVATGGVDKIMPLRKIPDQIMEWYYK